MVGTRYFSYFIKLGINELDYVEIMIGVENEFRIEISDEVV